MYKTRMLCNLGREGDYYVELSIDTERLAQNLLAKGFQSKGGKSKLCFGTVVAKFKKVEGTNV